MKKIVKLCLILALAGLPIACGEGTMDIPPVTEQPQPPLNPSEGEPEIPDFEATPTPTPGYCPGESCDHGGQIGKAGDLPKVTQRPSHSPQINPDYSSLLQVDPCLLDPDSEDCEDE